MHTVLCNCQGRGGGFKVGLVPRYGALARNGNLCVHVGNFTLPSETIHYCRCDKGYFESDPNYESLLSHYFLVYSHTLQPLALIGDVVGAITPLVAVVSMWYIDEAVSKTKVI